MKFKTRKIQIPMQTMLARVQPSTINVENRTVEVVFTTGSRVRRHSWFDGPFIEELGLKKDEVDMSRLENKAPFLDSHGFGGQSGIRNVLGVVESASLIPNKEGRAVIRFSKRADVDEIFQDVRDGILSNVSVGYSTEEIKKVEERDGVPVFRSTKWTPGEISLVAVGADPKAQVRSEDIIMNDCNFIEEDERAEPVEPTPEINKIVADPNNLRQTNKNTGDIPMTKEEIEKARLEAIAEARKEEKLRGEEIRSIVAKVGLPDQLADKYIKEDKKIDDVRTLVIDELAEKSAKNPTPGTNQVHVGEDLARKGRVEGMTSSLLNRFRPHDERSSHNGQNIINKGYELNDAGRGYAYLSLLDMARMCLEEKGVSTIGMPAHRIGDLITSRSSNSTSDFPEILANVINKTLRNGYLAAPQTFQPFTSEVFVNDFKEISRVNLGDAEKLEKLNEGAEVKRSTISEAAEKYRVEEYAKIIAITRKTIVNDDLSAMTKIPERMGRRAADLESDLIFDIIKANDNLSDGVALFASAHGNLSSSPGAPTEGGLTEARAAMRRQLGLDGAEISLTPVWIFSPPAHETAIEKLIAASRPNNAADVNPFGPNGRTSLQMAVEPRLETGTDGSLTSWFVTADKGQIDMVELARLSGSNGPQTMTREGFDVHGTEFKIMHDVGAKAIDHRGLFKNAGA